jgi:hypothetical protein
LILDNGRGWSWQLVGVKFIGRTHSVWMLKGVTDLTSPFFSGSFLEVDGNMSWRESGSP